MSKELFKISYTLENDGDESNNQIYEFVEEEYHSKTISGAATWPEVLLGCMRFLRSVYYITAEDEQRVGVLLDQIMEEKAKGNT